MNFEHATQALDTISQAMRNAEQKHIVNDKELEELRADKEHYLGRLQELEKAVEMFRAEKNIAETKYAEAMFRSGELTATLKQVLQMNTDIASRAAEMLRNLEEKPEPVLLPPRKPEVQIVINEKEQPKATQGNPYKQPPQELKEKLKPFMAKDEADLKIVPMGELFVLDPPLPEDVTERGMKWWYKLTAGRCPEYFLRDRPGVEFRKEQNGPVFVRFVVAPSPAKEDREPLPFRTEEANTESNGQPPNAFADNGEDIPGFLRGPRHDDDQGRKASDL